MTTDAERYRYLKLKQAQAKATPAPAPERSTGDDVLGGVNAAAQGASLGFADEAASAIAAGGQALFGDTDESFGDIYDDIMETEKFKRRQFSEANPKTALGLEVAGGFLTGGAGGAKVLGLKSLQGAGKLKKALAMAGVGAAEGGVAGFGSGDAVEDRLTRAGTGAALGGAIPMALHGAGRGLRAASDKFKVADDIPVVDGQQMPLSLADPEGWRGTMYRDVVGEAFGGGKVGEQATPFIRRAEANVARQTAGLDEAVEAGKRNIQVSEQGIRDTAQKSVDELDTSFRAFVEKGSLPAATSPETLAKLSGKNPQETVKILGDEWVDKGFSVVTKRAEPFTINPEEFKDSVKKMFGNDPALENIADDYTNSFINSFDRVVSDTGSVNGADLMELRNKYARSANSTADPLQRKVFGEFKNEVDSYIKAGLNDVERKAFDTDKDAWDMFSNMRKATGKASNLKGGEYTPDEWLSSTQNTRLASEGGPMQKLAQDVQGRRAGLKKSIAQQIKDNPAKAEATAMKAAASAGLTQAKEAAQTLKSRGQKPPNLFRKIAATGLLSGPSLPAVGLLGAMPSGAATARVLSTPTAQRFIAGQSLDKTLTKLGKSKIKGLNTADILRQGAPSIVRNINDQE